MTQRGKYIFWLGCLVWLFIVAIADTASYDILENIADIRYDFFNEMPDLWEPGMTFRIGKIIPFLAATAGWCGASYLLGKIFGGK
jgi:hypothetical protein